MSTESFPRAFKLNLSDRSCGNGLAEIIDRYYADYCRTHKLSAHQHRVLTSIRNCRTRALGGHLRECDVCKHREIAYNSCGDRHCPKCQSNRGMKWLRDQLATILPIPYYHVVFTLPHELNDLCLCNQRVMYELFFQSATQTLQTFAADKRYLGGKLGIIAMLHTWGQNLSYHVHLHMIVTGGGLCEDTHRWRNLPYDSKFIFPVKAVSKVMRGKFLAGLRKLYDTEALKYPGKLSPLSWHGNFKQFMNQLYETTFYSYAKRPFTGSEKMFGYVGKYSNKVAISNSRIKGIDGGEIHFSYKDYRDAHKSKVMRLTSEEFLRRYLQHILPVGFRKIRYYGLFAPGCRSKYIDLIRKLLYLDFGISERDLNRNDLICAKCRRGVSRMIRYYSAVQFGDLIGELNNQMSFNFNSS